MAHWWKFLGSMESIFISNFNPLKVPTNFQQVKLAVKKMSRKIAHMWTLEWIDSSFLLIEVSKMICCANFDREACKIIPS